MKGMVIIMKSIITIGRQYGSGGLEIGELLANTLKIPLYDKEITKRAAAKCGMSEEVLAKVDETATSSFLYAISTGSYMMQSLYTGGNVEIPLNDQLYLAQTEIIQMAAREGPCVFVGRCADVMLRERKNIVRVFVYADLAFRRCRVSEYENVTEQKAEEIIAKADKKRASYYNFYTHKKWGDRENYDLMLNHSNIDSKTAAELILSYAAAKERQDAALSKNK